MGNFIKKTKNILIKAVISLFNRYGKNRVSIENPTRLLIITTTGIGDTLWGTPAIASLKETYPESYIGVLTNPLGFELLKENPNIDEIFIFKRGLNGLLSLPTLLKRLRHKGFETVFIFHASDRIIWPISYFTGASEIIGIDGQNKDIDFILTQTINPQNDVHGIEARLNLVKLAGVKAFHKSLSICLTDRDREEAVNFLKNQGINEEIILVGLHPGAQKPFKCWPLKNFISFGISIEEKFRCRIILTGNSDEKPLADKVASQIRGAVSVAGKLSLRGTAAVIERLSLFITNDTGPMHIAFAVKTPTIALFCPTNPKLCGPYNAENAIVIEKPVTCKPCIGKKCLDPVCMEQIPVEEVIAEAGSLLNNQGEL